jgi:hypothetical protein
VCPALDPVEPPPIVDTWDSPVPGIETVRLTPPPAIFVTRKPGTPAEKPMPDFEKFIRTPGAIRIVFLKRNPTALLPISRPKDARPRTLRRGGASAALG